MKDHIIFFVHIGNFCIAENARVGILTATFREECCLIQHHTETILRFFTGNYFCCKFGSVTVLIK